MRKRKGNGRKANGNGRPARPKPGQMAGRILMNSDRRQFYCFKHDRWFHHVKMVQCLYRGCTGLYEDWAPHVRRRETGDGRPGTGCGHEAG